MKKKILFVLNHFQFSDGVAATLRSLIMNINMNNFEIHVLPLYKCDREFVKPIESKVTIHKGIGFYFRGLSKLINKIPLNILYLFFIKEKYDIEIAYQYGLPTKMISVSPNKNKICWMHTYDATLTLKDYYKKFPKIINVAKIGCDKLRKEGFSQVDYCYNIIDEDDLIRKACEPLDILPSRVGKKVIATVCRIDPDKAILRQIKCIESIAETASKYEFWIIGDGSEFLKIQTYLKDHGLNSFIKLLGRQNNPYKFLNKADLYLCASLREGFSTACQEAAILGIPVVSTNVDGAQELVEMAGCGEVIPNNEQSIIYRLSSILTDDSLISTWKRVADINKVKFYKQPRIAKIETILDQYLF